MDSLTLATQKSKAPQGQITRWLDYLAEYDFTIEHLQGTSNAAADALNVYAELQQDPPVGVSHHHYICHYQLMEHLLYFSVPIGLDDFCSCLCVPNIPW
ncbi:uncharacterized protein V1518DRAFT_423166 [Limtongia smithiae]|uniref:uncharacterized protein n=1 Tax=Limtongia smithiae TaxID=1125753 RepID=UPI0034CDBD9C